jgi:signal transduction histidine kinase
VIELQKRASEIAADVQALSHELHSSKIDLLGIATGMRLYCREFADQHKTRVDFEAHDVPDECPSNISLNLFRVLQEALHNSLKHSGARKFAVRLSGSNGELSLEVRDGGEGFDLETARTGRGIGLVNMGERVKLVGGDLSIESQPRRGTTIRARVPFSPHIG